jgi:DNA polymerase I-like protein with 3'-5' exonuclease and polymerase domains
MTRFVLDLESNGLLPTMDKIHCIVLYDLDKQEYISCADQPGYNPLSYAIECIQQATLLVGHNIIKFDIPALKKIYPDLILSPDCTYFDTLITSRLFWPELEPVDHAKYSHIERKYFGRHSLAAWGERLGVSKIDFKAELKEQEEEVKNVWESWSATMQTYCEGDVKVSIRLYDYMLSQQADPRSVELEHQFALVMAKQEQFGFPFNEKAAFALVNTLKAKRTEINDRLQEVFPSIVEERWSTKTGKRLKNKVQIFNPGSRQQTSERLKALYPEITFDTTEKGNPQVDDDVLEKLGTKYPEAKLLAEYQTLNKRLGQIAEGKEAWLKHVQVYGDGRIHGEVITNACISGRCSHKRPNMAQVPSVGHAYGSECRALFYAPDGWKLVGADASGLELRALGAWLAYFDEGDYARLVSDPAVDIHSYNARMFGIYSGDNPITKAERDLSKKLIFALAYGAGAKKVGSIVLPFGSEDEQYKQGKKTMETFYDNLPAIKQLKDLIEKRVNEKGYLTGIDGRRLQIRSKHAALNQLLQSTGAIAVKKATCILYEDLKTIGLEFGKHWGYVAHVHDEFQALVLPAYVETYMKAAIDSFKKAGEYFNLKCPLTGEARVGQNWMESH